LPALGLAFRPGVSGVEELRRLSSKARITRPKNALDAVDVELGEEGEAARIASSRALWRAAWEGLDVRVTRAGKHVTARLGPDGQRRLSEQAIRDPRQPRVPPPEALHRWLSTLRVPDDHEIGLGLLYSEGEEEPSGWRSFYLLDIPELTGDLVKEAKAEETRSESGSGWQVMLTFSPEGARRFEEVTSNNVRRRFAVVLDERVESVPVIRTKIPGGHAVITMGSTDAAQQKQDARRLVLGSAQLAAPVDRL
jgi:hypothetical protein